MQKPVDKNPAWSTMRSSNEIITTNILVLPKDIVRTWKWLSAFTDLVAVVISRFCPNLLWSSWWRHSKSIPTLHFKQAKHAGWVSPGCGCAPRKARQMKNCGRPHHYLLRPLANGAFLEWLSMFFLAHVPMYRPHDNGIISFLSNKK